MQNVCVNRSDLREVSISETHVILLLFYNSFSEEFIMMMKKMPEKKEELREAFKTFDADGDGCTTRSELRKVMIKFGQNLTDQELDAVMLEVDKNRDGVISFSEFIEAMETYRPPSFRD